MAGVELTRVVETLAGVAKSGQGLSNRYKGLVDANDPKAQSYAGYLDGVGVLFSQAVTLQNGRGEQKNFEETLANLRQDQVTLTKRMSFFGRGAGSDNNVIVAPTTPAA